MSNSKINMQALLAKAREAKAAREDAQAPVAPATPAATPPIVTGLPEGTPTHMRGIKEPAKTESIVERIARLRQERTQAQVDKATKEDSAHAVDTAIIQEAVAKELGTHTGMDGTTITYNSQQQEFVELIASGQSCVLIGAAGTGKTTSTQGGISKLIQEKAIPPLQADGHKHLRDGTPGVIIISYTRRAVNNIRKVLPEDLKYNAITAHKLLEYAPVYYQIEDEETGIAKNTMRFEPTRCPENPLPPTIHTIVVEEASMLSIELFQEINAALSHSVQWVFIGDLNQLPPVFGSAILGFKLLELPVVELTEVYRQALESPIIRLAHRVLSGKPIPVKEYADWHTADQLTIHPWKKKIAAEHAADTLGAFFMAAYDSGAYDIDEDMILIPYNKACGTIEVNKHIANHIARKHNRLTYEVLAGFSKHYFTVGDKVLYDKEDAEIVEINPNAVFTGATVQPASATLDYWGHNPNLANEDWNASASDDVDFLLDQISTSIDEDRVTQSSHVLTIKLLDTDQVISLAKAAEVNNLLHSYALTVHKAQGSEWRKVFLCLHQSHATMLQRELLYTGITRAKEELYVICEPESFTKGIVNQKIKGDTLAEKAEFFKGKVLAKQRGTGA